MTDPYTPPEHDSHDGHEPRKVGLAPPAIGCGVGGCLLPILLFIVCALLGDTGGPLIWPIGAVVFGGIGLVVGFLYKIARG
jgi:hypothetical protein